MKNQLINILTIILSLISLSIKAQTIDEAIKNRTFTFMPTGFTDKNSNVYIGGTFYLILTPASITSCLPNYNNSNGGGVKSSRASKLCFSYEYVSKKFSYSNKKNKDGSQEILITIFDAPYKYKIILDVDKKGYSTMDVYNSAEVQGIKMEGKLVDSKTGKVLISQDISKVI